MVRPFFARGVPALADLGLGSAKRMDRTVERLLGRRSDNGVWLLPRTASENEAIGPRARARGPIGYVRPPHGFLSGLGPDADHGPHPWMDAALELACALARFDRGALSW